MEQELRLLLNFLRGVHKLWTLRHWEREAAKALRCGDSYGTAVIFKHIQQLTKEA